MKKCIVPAGFQFFSHPVFDEFTTPLDIPLDIIVGGKRKRRRNDDVKCPICLQQCEHASTIVCCRHSFCGECLAMWLVIKLECPLCKSPGTPYIQYSKQSINELKVWNVANQQREQNNSLNSALKAAANYHCSKFAPITDTANDSRIFENEIKDDGKMALMTSPPSLSPHSDEFDTHSDEFDTQSTSEKTMLPQPLEPSSSLFPESLLSLSETPLPDLDYDAMLTAINASITEAQAELDGTL